MTYEIARKLKDAKFPPYTSSKGVWLCKYGDKCVWAGKGLNGKHKWMHICEGVGVPTLTELVEACGKINFINPMDFNFYLARKAGEWSASTYEGNVENLKRGNGSTPEIAVANLWLALNEKK